MVNVAHYYPLPPHVLPGKCAFFLFSFLVVPTPGHAKGENIIPRPRAPDWSHLRYVRYSFYEQK